MEVTARVLLTVDEIRLVEYALANHKTLNNMEQVIPVIVKLRTARHAMLNDGRATPQDACIQKAAGEQSK